MILTDFKAESGARLMVAGDAWDTPLLVSSATRKTGDGWDSRRERFEIASNATDASLLNRFTVGDVHDDFSALYLQDASVEHSRPGVRTIALDFLGIADERGVMIETGAAAETQVGENITTPIGFAPKFSGLESMPTMTIRWAFVGSLPSLTGVGTSGTPPIVPAIRPSQWDWIAEPTVNFPNGWVLMSRNCVGLAGVTSVWLVHDYWRYVYLFTP